MIRRRHGIRASVALGLALVLGGCTGLPSSSDVMVGRSVDENVAPDVLIVVPPPAVGASPEAIIRGFLRAGAAFQDNADNEEPVGNAYLARTSIDRWRPTSLVTVYDRETTIKVESLPDDRWRASVVAVATIDDTGRYRELAPGTVSVVELHLVRVGGEWRVELPDNGFGVWLNTDDFARVFQAHELNYPVRGASKRLVPDVRWFPAGPRLVTALARAQLGVVPDYLVGAVETGFPDGARLAVDAVPVEAGVATVSLTGSASSADLVHKREMWAQLVATLTALPGVAAVDVQVQGSGQLALSEVTDPVRSPSQVGYAAGPLPTPRTGILRTGDRLERVDLARLDDLGDSASAPPTAGATAEPTVAATVGPTTGVGGAGSAAELPTLPTAYGGYAVSTSGEIAAVAASGSELVRVRGRTQVPVAQFATAMTKPSYDLFQRLWVGGLASGAAGIWTIDASDATDRAAAPVTAAWLAGRIPVALSVTADGSRVAVVSQAAGGGDTRLDVAGITRDGLGRPTALAAPWRQGEPLTALGDVGWIDDTALAVLGAVPGDVVRPFVVQLGQGVGLRRVGSASPQSTLLREVAGARWVVLAGGERGLVVVADPPSVWVRIGGLWRKAGSATGLAVAPVG